MKTPLECVQEFASWPESVKQVCVSLFSAKPIQNGAVSKPVQIGAVSKPVSRQKRKKKRKVIATPRSNQAWEPQQIEYFLELVKEGQQSENLTYHSWSDLPKKKQVEIAHDLGRSLAACRDRFRKESVERGYSRGNA